jgi:hypothetical protein
MRSVFVGCAVVAGLVLSNPAAMAQPSHGTPPGLLKKGGPPVAAAPDRRAEAPETIGGHVRSFGVWLDDATAMAPAESWMTVSLQRWGSPAGSGLEAPVVDIVSGITSTIHAFATVPLSRIAVAGVPPDTELGTAYLGGKVVLREPAEGVLGLAANPAVEILSQSATIDTGLSRVNLVLPLSVEWRSGRTRTYGSTGYFTRGAFFMSGALERQLSDRTVVTGALSQAWATDDLALADGGALRSSRTDLTGSLVWIASPQLMLFTSAARTLSPLDADAIRYSFSVGASMNLYRPGRRLPVKKP